MLNGAFQQNLFPLPNASEPESEPARTSLGTGGFFNYRPSVASFGLTDDDRSEIELEKLATESRLRREHVNRLKDDAASQLIADNIKESQDRLAGLENQLAETQRLFSAPSPNAPTSLSFRPEEAWTGIIAMLAGIDPTTAANSAANLARQRMQTEFENDMRKYGLDQQRAGQLWTALSRDIDREQSTLDRLGGQQIANEQDLRALENQQTQFRQNVELRKADDARQDLRLRTETFNKNVSQYWNLGGEIPSPVREQMNAERDSLIRGGVDPSMLTQVPTGQTVRAADLAADNLRADQRQKLDREKFTQSVSQFEKGLNLKLRAFAFNQKNANRDFDQRVLEFQTKLANGYYQRNPKARADDLDKTLRPLDKAIENINTQLAGANKEAGALQTRIAGAGDFEKSKLQSQLDAVDQKRQRLTGMLDYRNQQKRTLLPPIDEARQLARRHIEAGKDPAWIRNRFKTLYGEDL